MPISGSASFVPTTQAFLSHWTEVDAALPPAAPLTLAGAVLGVSTPVTLATLTGLYDNLLASRTTLTDALVDLDFARADLLALKTRLLARMGELIDFVRGNLPASKFERALPLLPNVGDAQNAIQDAGGRLRRVWQSLNAATGLGLTLPVTLRGAYTLAMFTTDVDALAPAYLALAEQNGQVKLDRETRNDIQGQIAPVLKAYRQVMPTYFPPGSALTESLPAYSPGPGGTPKPVDLTGTWDAAAAVARFTFTPSLDPALATYELRVVPGPDYVADDETTVASLPGTTAAREFASASYLGAANQQAAFKVYVLLATGHESGSSAVVITRPGV